jgi:phospholipase/carboxylesterase
MPTNPLETVIVEPKEKAVASVIFLHGLGADGHDFTPVVPQLNQLTQLPIRYIFPHAPLRAVTINNGYVMRAWYDIAGLDRSAKEDSDGMATSAKSIEEIITAELTKGISTQKIILAGFSQGGAIAIYTGLRYPSQLGGIIALSTYVPVPDQLAQEKHEANYQIPIFLAHGTQDSIIPFSWGEITHKRLHDYKYKVSWHKYNMAHSVCPEEIVDIGKWLKERLTININ